MAVLPLLQNPTILTLPQILRRERKVKVWRLNFKPCTLIYKYMTLQPLKTIFYKRRRSDNIFIFTYLPHTYLRAHIQSHISASVGSHQQAVHVSSWLGVYLSANTPLPVINPRLTLLRLVTLAPSINKTHTLMLNLDTVRKRRSFIYLVPLSLVHKTQLPSPPDLHVNARFPS